MFVRLGIAVFSILQLSLSITQITFTDIFVHYVNCFNILKHSFLKYNFAPLQHNCILDANSKICVARVNGNAKRAFFCLFLRLYVYLRLEKLLWNFPLKANRYIKFRDLFVRGSTSTKAIKMSLKTFCFLEKLHFNMVSVTLQ